MNLHMTIFEKAFFYDKKQDWVFDNKVTNSKKLILPWTELVGWVTSGHELIEGHKNEQQMFNCTHYRECGEEEEYVYKRACDVVAIDALLLDYDNGYTIGEFKEKWSKYEWALYTSFSHTQSFHKFRVIMPLVAPISVQDYKGRTEHLNEMFSPVDESTWALSRAFFVPGATKDNIGDAQTLYNKGNLFEWQDLKVTEQPEYEHKEINYTDLKGDEHSGKIIWDTIDSLSMFRAAGLHQHNAGGNKHEVRCPWINEHSTSPETGAAIFTPQDGRDYFNCLHGSHVHKTMYDAECLFRERYGKEWMRQFYQVEPTKTKHETRTPIWRRNG